jgi:hypothetical protein
MPRVVANRPVSDVHLADGNGRSRLRGCRHAPLALDIERIVNNELLFEDFLVAQAEGAKSERHPPQPLAGWVWAGRVRVCGTDGFTQQLQGGIGKVECLKRGVERHVLPVLAQFTTIKIVGGGPEFGRFLHDRARRDEKELGLPSQVGTTGARPTRSRAGCFGFRSSARGLRS